MATEIGIIKTLIGTAVATATDGSQRTLQAGDRVYQDEVISTGAAGAVEVEFADGSVMTLGRSSQAILDLDVYNPQDVAQGLEETDSEVDVLQQALLDGADPSQVADATAAGAGTAAENEGVDIVQVIYEAPEVTPDNGFDTTGITVEFDEAREEDDLVLADDAPTAGITTVLLDEDDLIAREKLTQDFITLRNAFVADEDDISFADRAYAQGNDDEAEGDDLQPGALTILSGNLAVDFGDDGTGDIVFNAEATQPAGLTSGDLEIEYWVSDDGHSLVGYVRENGGDNAKSEGPAAKIIFTAEILNVDTGEFRVALYGPVDHPDGTTEDNLFVNLGFTVSDVDGDTAAGTLRLDIDDDSPVVEPTEYYLTITNHRDVNDAGFDNSYGYYIKGDNGEPTEGVILWANVNEEDFDTFVVEGYSPDQIGFFIIPNGDNLNRLKNELPVDFEKNDDGEWQAFFRSNPLFGDTTPVLFDNGDLNADGKDHFVDNDIIGNQNWEDTVLDTHDWADDDHNDVNIDAQWTIKEADVDYGADGPGNNFLSGDVIIIGEDGEGISELYSNGQEIIFSVEDTNEDGIDDLVGKAGGEDVLRIESVLGSDDYDVDVLGPIDKQEGLITIHAEGSVTDGDGDGAIAPIFTVTIPVLDLPPQQIDVT